MSAIMICYDMIKIKYKELNLIKKNESETY